jgi:uncharacterized protein YbjT (DUF2867 family)
MGADHSLVLLTGASGYIGGRLLKELEKEGWPVRCLARRPDFLRPKVAASTEAVKADCLDRSSLAPAMAGVHTAYYLVHSTGSTGKFEQEDCEAAQNCRPSPISRTTTHYLSRAAWGPKNKRYPLICAVVTKLQTSCEAQRSQPSNFAHPS